MNVEEYPLEFIDDIDAHVAELDYYNRKQIDFKSVYDKNLLFSEHHLSHTLSTLFY